MGFVKGKGADMTILKDRRPPCGARARRRRGESCRFAALIAGTLTACALLPAQAVPACPGGREVTQPDGRVFSLNLRGDESFFWHETAEGFAVQQDASDGFWTYARPAADRAAFLPLPGARVGSADPLSLGLVKHAMPDAQRVREARLSHQRMMRAEPEARPAPDTASAAVRTTDAEGAPAQPPQPIPVAGTKTIRNVVILACFSNHWNSAGGTVNASYGRVAVSEYTNLFNQAGHTADGAVGSVRDYYREVSYSNLTVESVVSAWVKLPKSESYYGADGTSPDTNLLQMFSDAIAAADSAGFDFAQGDSDGDGWVDCLTVIHSGHGQEITGNPSTCIWSQQGELASYVTKDGVKMKRCHTEPALRGSTSSTSIIRIGVICHEMGHFFGLPDLYDYSNFTDGIGKWGIMAYGSWNGSEGNRPAHFSAYSKCMLGFVKPVIAHSLRGTTLARVENNASVLMLRDGMTNGEYFLVENRANAGFDNDPASLFPGAVIYHVDGKSVNNDLSTWSHPLLKIEEADGDDSLGLIETPTDIMSEPNDVWTSTSGLSGGFRDQTGVPTANAMMYQASTIYSRTNGAPSYSYLRVTNFSAAASTMSFDVQTLRAALSNQTVYTTGHTVSWSPCSQATQYEIQAGSPAALTSFTDGAEDEEALYENWYVAGNAGRSTAGKR